MQGGVAGVLARGVMRGLAVGVLAIWVSGCVTNGEHTGSVPSGARTSVAFESIDGAPPAIFEKLVQKLNEEAEARQLPVVTREGYAPYRIRGYVAASVVKKQTVVSWVWDVYDGETRRAARLTGDAKAGPAGADAWNAANDAVLAQVARSGMEQLAAFLNGPPASPSSPAPAPSAPEQDKALTVAAADDFRRPASTEGQEPAVTGAIEAESGAPLPPRRPIGRSQQVAFTNAF